jgi:rhamnosyltransferase
MISVIIPTLNASKYIGVLLESLKGQTRVPDEIIVIDSSSEDDTRRIAKSFDAEVIVIKRKDFNHGGTRNLGVHHTSSEIVVFLTQDALPADEYAIENLIKPFYDNKDTVAAYGRQLPRQGANPIEAYARLFNYPPTSLLKSSTDISKLGIRTAFLSNAFAAYRRSTLLSIGGFPSNTIVNEDTHVTAKMLLEGWKIAYCADAKVYHSHNYSFLEEFQRYFDIGVFHAREPWIRQRFGQAEPEGIKYVRSELKYLLDNDFRLIPSALLRTAIKLTAYRLGFIEQKIPVWLKVFCSMNKQHWRNSQNWLV